MSYEGDPAAVARELLWCARVARERGYAIVCDAFQEERARPNGKPGVCALGAYNAVGGEHRLSLPTDSDALAEAWDAIEIGFDGGEPVAPAAWYGVGLWLRMKLKPRSARS